MKKLNFGNYPNIPSHTQGSLQRYVDYGLKPSSFLLAVLCNDLIGAAAVADPENRAALADIALFVYKEVPYFAQGSMDQINTYCERQQSECFS